MKRYFAAPFLTALAIVLALASLCVGSLPAWADTPDPADTASQQTLDGPPATPAPMTLAPQDVSSSDVAKIGDTGYPTLQAAIDAAADGDTVELLANTKENIIVSNKSITLELGDKSIDGDKRGSTLTIEDTSAVIHGGTIADGKGTIKGGGIYLKGDASLIAIGTTIANNTCVNEDGSSAYGAGLFVGSGSAATLEGCVITGNSIAGTGWRTHMYGGGICVESNASIALTECTISENTLTSAGSYVEAYGAGISLMSDAQATLAGCTLQGNKCANSITSCGGAIYIQSSASANLSGCTLEGNYTRAKTGSAAYVAGTLVLDGGKVTNNATEANASGAVYGAGTASLTAQNVVFSGNSHNDVRADSGTGKDKEVKLTECTFSAPADPNTVRVFLQGPTTAKLEQCSFVGCGAALFTNAMYQNVIKLSAKGCDFSGNSCRSNSIVNVGYGTEAAFDGCSFSGNKIASGGSYGVLLVEDECIKAELSNSTFSNNELTTNATIITHGELVLDGVLISDNKASLVGGIQIAKGGSAELADTIVRNNVATTIDYAFQRDYEGTAGGVSVATYSDTSSENPKKGTLIIHSGAIYDNEHQAARSGEDAADDVFVQGKCSNNLRPATIQVDIKASQMADGTVDFKNMKWKDLHSSDYEDVPEATSEYHRYYTIREEGGIFVAQVGGIKYETIQEAVDAAQSGDTVVLIADAQTISSSTIVVNKALTIDLLGHTVRGTRLGVDNELLRIADSAQLVLKNSVAGGGFQRGTIKLNEHASLVIEDTMAMMSIIHNGDVLTLQERLGAVVDITLGDGRFVTLGDKWQSGLDIKNEGIKLTLSTDDAADANGGNPRNTPIVNNGSAELLRSIKVSNVSNPMVQKTMDGDNVVLTLAKGIFLASSGNDAAGNGLSPDKPVKTFARAKQLLSQYRDQVDGIYITDVYVPDQNEVWDMSDLPSTARRPVYRYKAYTGNLIDIRNGNFTLRNVILDGNKAQMDDTATSMVRVYSGGLYIEDGAELRNNNASGPDVVLRGQHLVHGGAVHCETSFGTSFIVMNGGWIHDNEAFMGGGIFAGGGYYSGDKQKLVMNGGVIENNRAVYYDELSRQLNNNTDSSGGGVMLAFGAYMTMNDGVIRNNTADSCGGGISLGNRHSYYSKPGDYETYEKRRVTLTMNGGVIDGNMSLTGGGMYVQCETVATLYGGAITNNRATDSATQPRGGGIYVNGRHGFDTVEDGVLNIPVPVEMTGNNADFMGEAIMTCATSLTFIRDLNGAIIHDNGDDMQVAFTSYSAFSGNSINMRLHSYLSEFMPGGGEYDWLTAGDAGKAVPADYEVLRNVVYPINVTTPHKAGSEPMDSAMRLAKVFINNNSTQAGGGAIGNNGSVFLGQYLTRVDVHVQKEWANDNGFEDRRPASIDVVLERNGVDYAEATLTPDVNGVWQHTFSNLQRYEIDAQTGLEDTSKPVAWSVREKRKAAGYLLTAVAEGASTERPANASEDPAAPTNPIAVRNFTITNSYSGYTPAIDDPPVHKVVKGNPSTQETFTFAMVPVSTTANVPRMPLPGDSDADEVTAQVVGAGEVEIGIIKFAEPGTYVYRVYEKNTGLADWTYDTTVYTVIYVISVEGDGLVSKRTIEANGTTVGTMTFTNVYEDPTPSPTPTPTPTPTPNPQPQPLPQPKPVLPAAGDSALALYDALIAAGTAMLACAAYLRRKNC